MKTSFTFFFSDRIYEFHFNFKQAHKDAEGSICLFISMN